MDCEHRNGISNINVEVARTVFQKKTYPLKKQKNQKMGGKHSCELSAASNVCRMHHCIERIKSIGRRGPKSQSANDVWLCLLKGATFNGQIVERACMKVSFNELTVPFQDMDEEVRLKCKGLAYEVRVYNEITTPLLDAFVCPHFLRSYLVSTDCGYSDLYQTIEKSLTQEIGSKRAPLIPDRLRVHNLNRSLYYIRHALPNRPAIDDKPTPFPDHLKGVKYTVLTTEMGSNVMSYMDWLKQGMDTPEGASLMSRESRLCVLLQIVIALYVMGKVQLFHGDLHGDNILIQTGPEKTWTYVINDPKFGKPRRITLRTRLKVVVYDFDRSVCFPELKANALNAKTYGPYRGFPENQDLVALVANLSQDPRILQLSEITNFFDVRLPAGAGRVWDKMPGNCLQNDFDEGMLNLATVVAAGNRHNEGVIYTIDSEKLLSGSGRLKPQAKGVVLMEDVAPLGDQDNNFVHSKAKVDVSQHRQAGKTEKKKEIAHRRGRQTAANPY